MGAPHRVRAAACPGSIHSLLAARLDTLSPEQKAMLADAAVVGKVFWAGAVAAMGDRGLEDVTSAMRELSRKELVRIARRSSMQGESEYAFWHVLTRDVAYGQMPRASRASRHVAAARWIESKAPERVEDLADVLAYHYAAALELARAAGEPKQAADLEVPALRFLTLAGDRALGLDTAAALSNFERALELTPPGHPDRPEALVRFGEAAFQAGTQRRGGRGAGGGDRCLPRSRRSRRHSEGDAFALRTTASVRRSAGVDVGSRGLGAPRALATWPRPRHGAHQTRRGSKRAADRPEAGIRYAERALVLAEELGLPRPADALDFRGISRCALGDPGGCRTCARRSPSHPRPATGRRWRSTTTTCACTSGASRARPRPSRSVAPGSTFARTRGLIGVLDFLLAGVLDLLIDTGELDEALTIADDMAPGKEENGELPGAPLAPRRAGAQSRPCEDRAIAWPLASTGSRRPSAGSPRRQTR